MIPFKFSREIGEALIWAMPLALAMYWILDRELLFNIDESLFIIFTSFYFLILARYIINKTTESNDMTREMINERVDMAPIKQPSPFGIEKVYGNQIDLISNYIKLLNKARYEVRILGGSLLHFYMHQEFKSSTIDAIKRGVRFRILVMDPSSNWTDYISLRDNQNIESLSSETISYINIWNKIKNNILDNNNELMDAIELRLYNAYPNLFLLIVDDTMFFAPYIDSCSFLDSPFFEIDLKKSDNFLAYSRLFDRLWENSSIYRKW